MLDRTKLERAMGIVVEGTKETIIPKLGPGDDIATMLFLLDEDGIIQNIVNLLMVGDIPPRLVEEAVKEAIEKFNAHGYIVQSTMWMLKVESFDQIKVRPSESPDRGECYTLSAGSATDSVMWSFEITRTEGKITHLEKQEMEEGTSVGLFVDLMGKPATVH